MKNYIASFGLLLSVAGSLVSCRETSRLPAPTFESVPMIIPVISPDLEKNHFDYDRARLSNAGLATLTNPTRPVFEFSFELDNTRSKKVKAVEVYKTFQRGTTLGTRIMVGSYTSFPATVSIGSQDALTGLQRVIQQPPALPYLLDIRVPTATLNSTIIRNDAILFTFGYVMEDDSRVVPTPVNMVKVGPPPGSTVPPPVNTVPVLANTTQINAPFSVVAVFR